MTTETESQPPLEDVSLKRLLAAYRRLAYWHCRSLRLHKSLRIPALDGKRYGMEGTLFSLDMRDKALLRYAEELVETLDRPVQVLDVGGARAGFGKRFARRGCHVTILDIGNFGHAIALENKKLPPQAPKMRFVQGDVRNFDFASLGETFDIVICNRLMHFLSPPEGTAFLKNLRQAMHEKTRGFFTLLAGQDILDLPKEPRHPEWQKRFAIPSFFSKLRYSSSVNVPLMYYTEGELGAMFHVAGLDTPAHPVRIEREKKSAQFWIITGKEPAPT
jgi:SAM-dependent methyltransferase